MVTKALTWLPLPVPDTTNFQKRLPISDSCHDLLEIQI